jgi:peptide/nickel transport system permease protein
MSSMTRLAARRFVRHRAALASGVLLVLMALAAGAAPLVEMLLGVDGNEVDLLARFGAAGPGHPLGTDELGRDVLVRLLFGGQVSLIVALITAFSAALIGAVIGLSAGYYGGWIDTLLMRLTDGVIALPLLPLLIILAAVDMSKIPFLDGLDDSAASSLYRIVLIITLVGWTTVARLVRGAALSLRTREYVLAARSMGASGLRIMTVHILPNVMSPIIVATTLSVGNIILFESVLSFLGLGIQPPIASWGNMLNNAQELIYEAPALAFYPGMAIFLTVIAFNFLGDGLQDALDPKATGHERGDS